MLRHEAINKLRSVQERLRRAIKGVGNKRSWRDSEKAMAVSSYRLEIEAIDLAVKALEDVTLMEQKSAALDAASREMIE